MDLLEESCNEPYRFRGCASAMACGFGLLRGTKPPCARAVPRSARWRGAPADAPAGGLGGSQALRLRCFRSVQAGSWLRGAAPPPASIREPTLARRGSVLTTARGRSSNEVLYAGKFQIFTPPLTVSLFLELEETLLGWQVLHAQSLWQPQTTAVVLNRSAYLA